LLIYVISKIMEIFFLILGLLFVFFLRNPKNESYM